MTQYVNLTRKNAALQRGEEISSLGPSVRLQVKLSRRARSPVRYRLVADGGNAVYTDTEHGKKPSFKPVIGSGAGETDSTGVFRCTITLPPSGGDKYTIEATRLGSVLKGNKETKSTP